MFKVVLVLDGGEILGFAQSVGVDPERGGRVCVAEPLGDLVGGHLGTNPMAVQLPFGGTLEQVDEWEAGDRRFFSEAFMLELATVNTPIDTIEEVNLIPELTAA